MSSSPAMKCQNCGKPCTLKCGKCQAMYFCGADCQKAQWPSHKAICKRVAQATEPHQWHLIVDGMGPIGPNWEYMKGARQAMESAGLHVVVVDVSKGGNIPEQLASIIRNKNPQSILMLGWGAGEADIEEDLCKSEDFKSSLVSWCRDGGRLLVQGERLAMFPWPGWFNLGWRSGDYCRTDHSCCAAATHWCDWYSNCASAVRTKYNVKACCLANVDPSDALYSTTDDSNTYSPVPGFGGRPVGTGQTAIAWSRFGEGTVSFFGDVNHEEPTLRTMAVIAARGQD